MALLRVNPNRMELMNLKKRYKLAQRGHKLLKDKQDELVRRFLEICNENRELRISVESASVGDAEVVLLSKDIAKKIETEMTYPGQIKVTVIRETRAVEYAK